jgi:ceramide glucosyltransferase
LPLVAIVLALWTAIALVWWAMAFVLVHRKGFPARPEPSTGEAEDRRWLTVFKPLATPLDDGEFAAIGRCLESFVADLDDRSDLLVGCHAAEKSRIDAWVQTMGERYPSARLTVILLDERPAHANPKVASMSVLAPHARGELWLWSDSDMTAPAGTLASLRRDFARSDTTFVTSPYVVTEADTAPALLDTLFVNVEFYPGAVLLGTLDQVRFGFGSAMLFEAAAFRRTIDWRWLGSRLAEDYHLGRLLAPARLGSVRLTTLASSHGWRAALQHYLRWQKTIRWCRPGSFAAQLVVLPTLGWLTWALFQPLSWMPWLGLAIVLGLEAAVALALCRCVDCRIPLRLVPAIPIWSLTRALSWLFCWLPWPIVWRGQRWWSAERWVQDTSRVTDTEGQPSY